MKRKTAYVDKGELTMQELQEMAEVDLQESLVIHQTKLGIPQLIIEHPDEYNRSSTVNRTSKSVEKDKES